MKKSLFSILFSVLILSACNNTQPQTDIQVDTLENKVVENKTDIHQGKGYTTGYLPDSWMIEDGIFYSPEMYNMREGGPYSLGIAIENNSSIEEYLADKENCTEQKNEGMINNHKSLTFIDTCANTSPKMTLVEVGDNLIKATSYSISDESAEINQILGSLELKN